MNTMEARQVLANHISKTVMTVALQFLFTFTCVLLTTFVPAIYMMFICNFVNIAVTSIICSFASLFYMFLAKRKTDIQLAIFTFFVTLTVCINTLPFGQTSVMLSLLITFGISACLSIYALTTKRDYTGMGPILLSALIALCLVGLMNIFIQLPIFHLLSTYAGIMVFFGYVIYDTQTYLTEKCINQALERDDLYIDAAINIYLNVISIFEKILRIIGDKK